MKLEITAAAVRPDHIRVKGVTKNYLSYSSTKTYVVGNQTKNNVNETVHLVMSTKTCLD